jgi:hypothetical protein
MKLMRERGFTGFTFCAQCWSMQNQSRFSSIGAIYATLAKLSERPRYAFLVLQLVTEAADERGRAGPLVHTGETSPMFLRDWLCTQLLPMSERDGRRSALRARVVEGLRDQLTGEAKHDEASIETAIAEQVLAVGRANVSRSISDLVKAGFLSRYYAGYATNHGNRGGGRHAVYVVQPQILSALGRGVAATPRQIVQDAAQGQLFAV